MIDSAVDETKRAQDRVSKLQLELREKDIVSAMDSGIAIGKKIY